MTWYFVLFNSDIFNEESHSVVAIGSGNRVRGAATTMGPPTMQPFRIISFPREGKSLRISLIASAIVSIVHQENRNFLFPSFEQLFKLFLP